MIGFLTTLPNHVHQIAAACLCYFALMMISPILSARVAPNLYLPLSKRTRINWDTRVVSTIQAIFICTCAMHVRSNDATRLNTDAQERLQVYSPMAGRVQAFATGYFLWDLLISARYLRVLGIGSLTHAFCALLVTVVGFVSSELPIIGLSLTSAVATFCQLLRGQPCSVRALNTISQYTLVAGQMWYDRNESAACEWSSSDHKLLRLSHTMGYLPIYQPLL